MHKWIALVGKGIKISAIALIPISYLFLTYSNWWKAPVASILIILLANLAWPRRGLAVVGLKIPLAQIGVSLVILGVVAVASATAIPAIATSANVTFTPMWENNKWARLLIHTAGQTLNEEIVLGALLLKPVRGKSKLTLICTMSAAIALVFSLAHYIFYLAIPPGFSNHGTLAITTLVSLFAVGAARNNCILSTDHIGYAWAIHLGWNAIFVNSDYALPGLGRELAEPAMFNAILGNDYLVIASVILMGLSLLLFLKKPALYPLPR